MRGKIDRNFRVSLMVAAIFAAAAFLFLILAVRSESPYPVYWDSRLDALNVTYHPATDCSAGCWRLVSAVFEDVHESGGLHHVFARTLDTQGNQIVDRFTVAWADGSVTVATKPPPDWGDSALWGCYFPDQGEAGGYRAWAGLWEANSDRVEGMGLPYCLHTSIRLMWQWQPQVSGTATPTPDWNSLFLPLIGNAPTN